MQARQERLVVTGSDTSRFVAAVTAGRVVDPGRYGSTSDLYPFSVPGWTLSGSAGFRDDGCLRAAVPGLDDELAAAAMFALSFDLRIARPLDPECVLDRHSVLAGQERKVGRSGAFRLLTVTRRTTMQGQPVADQRDLLVSRDEGGPR